MNLQEKYPKWKFADVLTLCRVLEGFAPDYGCHVALTGGYLYKSGDRKDVDILLYRIRQVERIDLDGFWALLKKLGFDYISNHGFVHKVEYNGKKIDFLIPEHDGEYV